MEGEGEVEVLRPLGSAKVVSLKAVSRSLDRPKAAYTKAAQTKAAYTKAAYTKAAYTST